MDIIIELIIAVTIGVMLMMAILMPVVWIISFIGGSEDHGKID